MIQFKILYITNDPDKVIQEIVEKYPYEWIVRNNKAVHELVTDMIFIKIVDINTCLCGCRGLKVDKVIVDDSLKTLIQNNSSFIDEIIIPMVNTPRIRFTDNTILRY